MTEHEEFWTWFRQLKKIKEKQEQNGKGETILPR